MWYRKKKRKGTTHPIPQSIGVVEREEDQKKHARMMPDGEDCELWPRE